LPTFTFTLQSLALPYLIVLHGDREMNRDLIEMANWRASELNYLYSLYNDEVYSPHRQ